MLCLMILDRKFLLSEAYGLVFSVGGFGLADPAAPTAGQRLLFPMPRVHVLYNVGLVSVGFAA